MVLEEKLQKIKILNSFPVLTLLGIFLWNTASGQAESDKKDNLRHKALNFFLDCRSCDMNFTRKEIPYVNFVRDPAESEVYLLVTRQSAGSGGDQYTFTFQGDGRFIGMNDTLVYTSNPDETRAIIREKKTNLIKAGLMRYVAHTPLLSEIKILTDSVADQEIVSDKWNNWVIELQTSPRFNAEALYNRIFFYNSINITKITPEIKLEVELDQSINHQQFIEDTVTTNYTRKRESADILFVKSLGAHWSAGLRSHIGASTSENYKLNAEIMPSVEYDIFPYSESTHRQFRVLYSAGYQYCNYIDSTILNMTRENLFKHELRVAYQVQEKWGSINISLTGSNYLHNFSKNRVELGGYMRLRIIRGLSLSVNGGIAYINDQLNLRKGDLTEAERLLRLKEQATNFSVRGGVSLTYTFGSIYNNVVNPRFGDGNGGGNGYN
jgi:hypothetical protein